MISLHHTHLMASDLDATIAFWRDGFGGELVHDVEFAGARNVFLRVGSGRIHLYDQPPKNTDGGALHHLGVVTDELEQTPAGMNALATAHTPRQARCANNRSCRARPRCRRPRPRTPRRRAARAAPGGR
jgi:catechol 2,3-dioxygenase-like lactoylglutathione lyase family enzyme